MGQRWTLSPFYVLNSI